ncbi:helix-turn-helix domain-containing protein [Carboxydocella sp. ULO1]|uniref:helix-turn-helix domain-containing protein n=1 Tax=Carboxydocella sp. ULO1 TaxID=1926599 RepID=UPI0009AD8569|nr:helix-turn-helix transcriptional regulator [Carboxydocella sp. ULO1]GAW28559.1 transcriptional regulator [Carboxydocella sp. ULO1]
MTFGSKLRHWRKYRKMTQQELGKITGIAQTTISDWENDKFLPDIDAAVKLATALGVSLAELIEDGPKDKSA